MSPETWIPCNSLWVITFRWNVVRNCPVVHVGPLIDSRLEETGGLGIPGWTVTLTSTETACSSLACRRLTTSCLTWSLTGNTVAPVWPVLFLGSDNLFLQLKKMQQVLQNNASISRVYVEYLKKKDKKIILCFILRLQEHLLGHYNPILLRLMSMVHAVFKPHTRDRAKKWY